MSSNNRILYSCQAVGISEVGRDSIMASGLRSERHTAPFEGTDAFDATQGMAYNYGGMVHGVQSIGITTNFNLEQVFELGQIDIYENIEGIPDVEITLEKVLDGYPLIYLMATTGVTGQGGSKSGILNRSKQQCDLRLGIFAESVDNVADADDNSGKSEVEVYCSGVYVSSVSYSFPVDGNFTESITLVGNNKDWLTGSKVKMSNENAGTFDGNDEPHALVSASGGVQRREDLLMEYSILPVGIKGVNGSGYGNAFLYNDGYNNPMNHAEVHLFMASGLGVHVQNVSISTDFSREDIFELGKKNPYYRPAAFPVEVSCEIEAVTTSGDFVTALENGDPALYGLKASGNNTSEENIFFTTRAGYCFDLGKKNRLSSVSYGGGDAGGGNVSCTYSYSNFNNFDVRYIGHNDSRHMGFEKQPLTHFSQRGKLS
mgnify:FL=1|jgi:hypothetical protein